MCQKWKNKIKYKINPTGNWKICITAINLINCFNWHLSKIQIWLWSKMEWFYACKYLTIAHKRHLAYKISYPAQHKNQQANRRPTFYIANAKTPTYDLWAINGHAITINLCAFNWFLIFHSKSRRSNSMMKMKNKKKMLLSSINCFIFIFITLIFFFFFVFLFDFRMHTNAIKKALHCDILPGYNSIDVLLRGAY